MRRGKPTSAPSAILILLGIVLLCQSNRATGLQFRDVSRAVGLDYSRGKSLKFGGASVADLNADGHPDLLFVHHDQPTELYFNKGDGTFKKYNWDIRKEDVHGLNPYRPNPRVKRMYFSLSRGGARGKVRNHPRVFQVVSDSRLREVTKSVGATYAKGRGRTAVYLNLRTKKSPVTDVIHLNARSNVGDKLHQKGMMGVSGAKFSRKALPGFATDQNWYATVGDFNNDGRMDVVSFHDLALHRVVKNFQLKDVTSNFLPKGLDRTGTVAVAFLDFNNDGLWDIYVARTNSGDLRWLRKIDVSDYLLLNKGGSFVNVAGKAGIPKRTQSRGVTTGDFNNDGYIDIIVTRFKKPDLLMLNKGDGTFRVRSAGFRREKKIEGDMATAVDYDRDGRLDVILSEGAYSNNVGDKGFFRIMRNLGKIGNFLLIRVGNSPGKTATSHHALVKVKAGKLKMMRRVGSPGTAVSNSYIELMHFGLGNAKVADSVVVTWLDGKSVTRRNVKSRSKLTIGVV